MSEALHSEGRAPDRAAALTDALVAAGAADAFLHDGLIFNHVPLWTVQAYAAGRLARVPAEALLRALIASHMGEETVRVEGRQPGWIMWRIGRAWAWRLGELERKARGLAAAA